MKAVADLADGAVVSWKEIPGAQPAVNDSRFRHGRPHRARRFPVGARPCAPAASATRTCTPWPGRRAISGCRAKTGQRIVRVTPYLGSAGANYYAHPDRRHRGAREPDPRRIIDFLDIDRRCAGSANFAEMTPRLNQPLRTPPAPLDIAPARRRRAIHIEDGEVRWQKWRFRYALHPREGLVLYTVGYEDGGRVRPVMYRGSLAEMVVPYGDPGAWFFRNSFDVGRTRAGTAGQFAARRASIARRTARSSTRWWRAKTGEPQHHPGRRGALRADAGMPGNMPTRRAAPANWCSRTSARRATTNTASTGSSTRTARWK